MITAPDDYSGSSTDVIPGSKIKYTTDFENQSSGPATNCTITDIIPNNTHLYYVENVTPTLNGDISNVSYQGVTNNVGPNNEVKFQFDIDANGSASMNFTVTID